MYASCRVITINCTFVSPPISIITKCTATTDIYFGTPGAFTRSLSPSPLPVDAYPIPGPSGPTSPLPVLLPTEDCLIVPVSPALACWTRRTYITFCRNSRVPILSSVTASTVIRLNFIIFQFFLVLKLMNSLL